ncbi:hypothetical protein ACQP1W_40055 [Spirillospora sp. CA-255316]
MEKVLQKHGFATLSAAGRGAGTGKHLGPGPGKRWDNQGGSQGLKIPEQVKHVKDMGFSIGDLKVIGTYFAKIDKVSTARENQIRAHAREWS